MEDYPFKNKAVFVKHIGEGTQGIVDKYKLKNGIAVVVKNLRSNDFDQDDINDTTLHELHALKVLSGCKGIIQLLDVEIDLHCVISIMLPYYKSDLMNFIKKVPFLERLKYSDIITTQLLEIFLRLNNRGIIHGDVKPQNILVDYKYDNLKLIKSPVIYLSDFGSSHQLSCDINYRQERFSLMGYTHYYAPPESNLQEADNANYVDKSDVYALGMTLLTYYIGKNFIELNLTDNPKFVINEDINSDIVMKSLMPVFHYELIPIKTINLLNSMLIKDIDDRAHITELISDIDYCKIIDTKLKRGILYFDTQITKTDYYDMVKILIEISKDFKLLLRTCIVVIDLLDRYLANYYVASNDFKLIGYTCLFLACKTVESYAPEISDFVWISGKTEDTISVDDFKKSQVLILQRCDYIILTCDIDLFYYNLLDKNYKVNNLYKLYDAIKSDNRYAGSLSYNQIIKYI